MSVSRRPPKSATRRELISRFDGHCAYCEYPIGTVVFKPGRGLVVSSLVWDHVLPYSYVLANPDCNWAITCQLCNAVKGAQVFDSMEALLEWVRERWEAKKYGVVWVPPVSSEVDPKRWATAYASWLCHISI